VDQKAHPVLLEKLAPSALLALSAQKARVVQKDLVELKVQKALLVPPVHAGRWESRVKTGTEDHQAPRLMTTILSTC
jgi:hypothetical protein